MFIPREYDPDEGRAVPLDADQITARLVRWCRTYVENPWTLDDEGWSRTAEDAGMYHVQISESVQGRVLALLMRENIEGRQ